MIEIALMSNNVTMRNLLKEVIALNNEFIITQETANSNELATLLQCTQRVPDIVVTDAFYVTPSTAAMTVNMLQQFYPAIKVLDFTTCYDKQDSKETNSQHHPNYKTLSQKIKEIVNRNDIIPGSMQNIHLSKESFDTMTLTSKQKLFLQLCTTELTYKEIAEKMNITPKTTDRYRDELFKKLNIKSRVGLALYAVRTGLANL